MVKVVYVTGEWEFYSGDNFRHDAEHHVFTIERYGVSRPIMITDHSVAIIGLWDEENERYK